MKRFKPISGACLALLSVCTDEAMADNNSGEEDGNKNIIN